jgi:small subunit ribosomal protein S7
MEQRNQSNFIMRRRRPEKRKILPDPVYGDLVVAKFINNLMRGGKKSLAEKIFYNSINKIENQVKVDNGIEYFKKAIDNVSPILEVKSKRIGGTLSIAFLKYSIPLSTFT